MGNWICFERQGTDGFRTSGMTGVSPVKTSGGCRDFTIWLMATKEKVAKNGHRVLAGELKFALCHGLVNGVATVLDR